MEVSALKKMEHFLQGQDSTLQRVIHNLLKRLFVYHHVGSTFVIFSTIFCHIYYLEYGQGGALGLATHLRIWPPSVFSNEKIYKNFERFLTTSRLSMMYHAFFKHGGFVFNLKFGGVI